MAWWGTFIGGTLGYVFGGPIGAVIGAALGGNFDRGIKITEEYDVGSQERVQAAFFTTTFSVMGHIAKADGRVSRYEIDSARHIMAQMQLTEEQRQAAIGLFDQGKAADFPLLEVLKQFKQECHGRRNLIQMFIEIQIAMAMADRHMDDAEKQILYTIGDALGFSRAQMEHLFSLVGAGGRHEGGAGGGGADAGRDNGLSLEQAYQILGVSKGASLAEVKKAYRRLMSQHHPDKLVAKGLPEEMIKLATEKTQEIRKAYELVKKGL